MSVRVILRIVSICHIVCVSHPPPLFTYLWSHELPDYCSVPASVCFLQISAQITKMVLFYLSFDGLRMGSAEMYGVYYRLPDHLQRYWMMQCQNLTLWKVDLLRRPNTSLSTIISFRHTLISHCIYSWTTTLCAYLGRVAIISDTGTSRNTFLRFP